LRIRDRHGNHRHPAGYEEDTTETINRDGRQTGQPRATASGTDRRRGCRSSHDRCSRHRGFIDRGRRGCGRSFYGSGLLGYRTGVLGSNGRGVLGGDGPEDALHRLATDVGINSIGLGRAGRSAPAAKSGDQQDDARGDDGRPDHDREEDRQAHWLSLYDA